MYKRQAYKLQRRRRLKQGAFSASLRHQHRPSRWPLEKESWGNIIKSEVAGYILLLLRLLPPLLPRKLNQALPPPVLSSSPLLLSRKLNQALPPRFDRNAILFGMCPLQSILRCGTVRASAARGRLGEKHMRTSVASDLAGQDRRPCFFHVFTSRDPSQVSLAKFTFVAFLPLLSSTRNLCAHRSRLL